MWQLTSPNSMVPDLARFVGVINEQAEFFDPAQPIIVARAPGRLDLMGGIADYSGALVLQLPLAVAAFVAVQWSSDAWVRVRTANATDTYGGEAEVAAPLADWLRDYATVHGHWAAQPTRHWATYIAGALTVLHHERNVSFPRGLRLLLASDVPPGKGVSSSAAIEVAAMQAVCGILDLQLEGRELALLCQKVENLVVGAPCGIMDQMTSACGTANSLLALVCQPAELEAPVALPDDVEVYGLDSGIQHAVSGADYGSVRVGAFMGYRVIAELAGLKVASDERGRTTVEDMQWRGYLANIPPSVWESRFRDWVPERLTGVQFMTQYGGFTDPVTKIDPARTYAVRQPTAHPIYENQRVRLFRALLQQRPLTTETLTLLGELMYQSHASYSACDLGTQDTDRLVELVREAGPERGLFGAKITGGGSGGTVAVLARRGSRAVVETIVQRYAHATGRAAFIIAGSSAGAVQFGTFTLTPHSLQRS
jgi:galactokinase